jgi:hypothetical protein
MEGLKNLRNHKSLRIVIIDKNFKLTEIKLRTMNLNMSIKILT